MHAISILHADLARAKDTARLEAAAHARRVRECRGRGQGLVRMEVWPVLAIALLLALAVGTGTVAASQADEAGAPSGVGRVAAGSVITLEAAGSGASVSALLQATERDVAPLKGMGAPGRAAACAIPDHNP